MVGRGIGGRGDVQRNGEWTARELGSRQGGGGGGGGKDASTFGSKG